METKRPLFFVIFADVDDVRIEEEQVKILRKGSAQTEIPGSFETLGSDYCSLGQTQKYYDDLLALGPALYTQILTGIKDVIFNRLSEEFSSEPAFEVSLLRFSEAEKIYREADRIFPWLAKGTDQLFRYAASVSTAVFQHLIPLITTYHLQVS